MRLMCLDARHAAAQTLNRNGIFNYHCKTHIKLDLVLERRVREEWAVQDIILFTSIYAPQVAPCSNGACGTSNMEPCMLWVHGWVGYLTANYGHWHADNVDPKP